MLLYCCTLYCLATTAFTQNIQLILNVPEGETFLTPDDFNAAKSLRILEPMSLRSAVTSDPLLRAGKFEGDLHGFANSSSMKEFVKRSNVLQRNAVNKKWHLWEDGVIPYTISTRYGSYSRSLIAKAINEYQQRSCIRFKPRNLEADYVHIFPDSDCYSLVGRVGGKQPLSLDADCIEFGTILHEMMHTVGFFHEQGRTDRDEYIDIQWENVEEYNKDQFSKYSLRVIQLLDVEYDYGSIMHYGKYAFSKNTKPTIIAKKAGGERMGQRKNFSQTDVIKLNRLYQCATEPEESDLPTSSPAGLQISAADCIDTTWKCRLWRLLGYCNQPGTMSQCPKSCGSCPTGNQLSLPTTTASESPESGDGSECEDISSRCSVWAGVGMCRRDGMVEHMKTLCRRTCQHCGNPTCRDQLPSCEQFVRRGLCLGYGKSAELMKKYCPLACGHC